MSASRVVVVAFVLMVAFLPMPYQRFRLDVRRNQATVVGASRDRTLAGKQRIKARRQGGDR